MDNNVKNIKFKQRLQTQQIKQIGQSQTQSQSQSQSQPQSQSQSQSQQGMGSQCSNNIKQQYQIIRTVEHPTLGEFKIIRNIKAVNVINAVHMDAPGNPVFHNGSISQVDIKQGQYIGVKQLSFKTQKQLNCYLKIIKQANLYFNIPTLLKVLSYQIPKRNKTVLPDSYGCGPTFPINVYFKYYSNSLQEQIRQRRQKLHELHPKYSIPGQTKPLNSVSGAVCSEQHAVYNITIPRSLLPPSLKLNNYSQIDALADRRLVNIFYQEIDILRMIDHIIGALYFLDHVQHRNEAVCPQNIMIDQEGKYVLIDVGVFDIQTNYQSAYQQIWNKNIHGTTGKSKANGNQSRIKYLSPELLSHLKNKTVSYKHLSEKAEVFAVGIIALDMCLIEFNLLDNQIVNGQDSIFRLFDRFNLKIRKNQIMRALVQVQSRYSQQLTQLLQCMLEYDPVKRVNFSTLIDILSPLLSQNLSQIQKLYNTQKKILNGKMSSFGNNYYHGLNQQGYANNRQNNIMNGVKLKNGQTYTHHLMSKLSQLQTNYQKIMNRTVLFQKSLGQMWISSNTGRSSSNLNSKSQSERKTAIGNEQEIIQDQKRILKELRKINIIKCKGSHLEKDEVGNKNYANASQAVLNPANSSQNIDRREVKGSQLYDIYLSEYETIKKNRFR